MKKSSTFKLIVSENVEKKIRYLCQKIWKDEWSGTLFYIPEGNFEDESLVIRCKDIFVMDVGNSVYTEFDMSPDVIGYMAENPELLNCQMGLIHSHNTMNTFFSNTDLSTLQEEGNDRNHFVSLIVNNEGTYTAAITRKVAERTVVDDFSYMSFEGKEVSGSRSFLKAQEIEYFYLDIEIEKDNSFGEELAERLKTIENTKKEKAASKTLIQKEPIKEGIQGNLFPSFNNYQSNFDDIPFENTYKKEESFLVKNLDKNNIEKDIFDGDLPYEYMHINKETTKSLLLQLVTGSVIISNASKINIKQWVSGMVPIYEKRFGKGATGMKLFKSWAYTYIEFLCWCTEDAKLKEEGWDDDYISAICAHDLINELQKLPQNVYIKEYIDILKGYLV